MNKLFVFLFLWLAAVIISCKNNDKKVSTGLNPATTYFDYKITAEEGDDNLTVMLQYRDGGKGGDAISIGEPGQVMLDGEILIADSAKMTGAFYEFYKPITEFAGRHTIVFTDINKKQYREEFDFNPITLLTPVADTIRRSDLIFLFNGLEPEDFVRVLLTDTSFANEGINRVDTVRNGRMIITKADMESFAQGPVQLVLIREYERPVKNGTEAGGRLLITYGLKREFFLKE